MRIGLVSTRAGPRAVHDIDEEHRHVGELAAALARGGHEVHVYGQEEHEGLDRRWADWRPDVVHSHSWHSGLAAVTGAREHGIPVVHSYHSLGAARRRWYGRANRERRVLRQFVRRVVALCQSEVTELTRLGVARDAISVVPSGVDTERFTAKGDKVPTEPGRPRILAVGPPGPASGYDEMITALRWIPVAELAIVGGPDTDGVRALAEDAGVAERVRLVGSVPPDRLPAWYRSAHVVASAASAGAYGQPAVEAMACGVPVVAYAAGGFADSVVHRVTGLLVQPHDVRGLAVTLRRLLTSDLDRLAYGDAGVDRAFVRYDWRRIVVDLERVYESVLT